MNKTKKIFSIASQIVLYLFIAVLLYVAVRLVVGQVSGKAVFFGNKSFERIVSPSMVNEKNPDEGINVGDYILIEKVDVSEIKEGDIISFYSQDPSIKGKINTHRVEKINEDGSFTTKGDNNPKADDYTVSNQDVIGRYVKTLTFITALINFLTQRAFVFILIISVIILIIIMSFMKGSAQNSNEDTQQKIQAEIEKIKTEGIENYSKNINDERSGKDV